MRCRGQQGSCEQGGRRRAMLPIFLSLSLSEPRFLFSFWETIIAAPTFFFWVFLFLFSVYFLFLCCFCFFFVFVIIFPHGPKLYVAGLCPQEESTCNARPVNRTLASVSQNPSAVTTDVFAHIKTHNIPFVRSMLVTSSFIRSRVLSRTLDDS